jgi:CelD/BcsL family acetyltransferase involved in cellulose biosynthesis
MHVERGGLEIIDRLADEWRDLLQRTSGDDPYSRPEWMLAHLRAYSAKANVVALSLRQSGNLSLVVPLLAENGTFSGIPARKLRIPLSMPGACSDLVMAPDINPEDAVHAVWEGLKSLPDWDVLELPSVYENTVMERLTHLAQKEGYHTGQWALPPLPWITLTGRDIEKLPPSSTLRSRLRQGERKLNELGNLSLHTFTRADSGVLQRFYDLEASGWKGQEKSAILCDPRSHQFFNEVAQQSEKFGYLVFYFLELDGKLIAAHFSLTYRQRYYAPKIAYDEDYRQYRVGHLILSKIMHECAKQGISEYPMGVIEEWKTEWTKESRARTFQCIFNKGARARLLFLTRFQIKPGLKRLMWRSGRQK